MYISVSTVFNNTFLAQHAPKNSAVTRSENRQYGGNLPKKKL